MIRKEIFTQLQSLIQQHLSLNTKIVDDHIYLYECSKDYKLELPFRCQDYGDVFVINSMGATLYLFEIEDHFRSFLTNDLCEIYKPDFTISGGTQILESMPSMRNFEIKIHDDILRYAIKIYSYFEEIKTKFLSQMIKGENIGKHIALYPFEDRFEVSVSSNFPLQLLKKIYFLKMGQEVERYEEYRAGLISLLKRYEEKKPDQKEKAEMFWKGFKYFIEKLESESDPAPPSA